MKTKLSKLSDNELQEYQSLLYTMQVLAVRSYLHVSKNLPSIVLRTFNKEATAIEKEIERREL
tara:strand:+ start:1437 stop:1625 length:189 start_codon:yes stop_codon:yes gene_type:complete